VGGRKQHTIRTLSGGGGDSSSAPQLLDPSPFGSSQFDRSSPTPLGAPLGGARVASRSSAPAQQLDGSSRPLGESVGETAHTMRGGGPLGEATEDAATPMQCSPPDPFSVAANQVGLNWGLNLVKVVGVFGWGCRMGSPPDPFSVAANQVGLNWGFNWMHGDAVVGRL
jgi:hypothetical protein